MSRTFFISDTHFSHKNILKYEPVRVELLQKAYPDINFNELTSEELLALHDNYIIKCWNQTVKNDDIVWFLGDFAFGNADVVKNFSSQLKGRKRIILGNHDRLATHCYYDAGFEYVSKYPVILQGKFILSHAPIMMDHGEMFNLYGHVHGNPVFPTKTEHSQCVCVERQEFKPITVPEFDSYTPVEVQRH